MIKKFAITLLMVFTFTSVFAEKKEEMKDPLDLEFAENLEYPPVGKGQANAIKKHMDKMKKAFEKHNLSVSTDRDGEILDVVIQCSELFAPNAVELKDAGKARLKIFADLLKHPTMYKIVVAVYSDNTGEPEYCENLTDERAHAIDNFFVELVNNDDVNVVPYGMGNIDPKVENNSIENRDRNRRVEIFIIPEYKMIESAKSGKLK